jgi:hypothetical protein
MSVLEASSRTLGIRLPDVKLPRFFHRVMESLSHWDDAVAMNNAFTLLQTRTVGFFGIVGITLEGNDFPGKTVKGRGFEVLVTSRTPATREVKEFVRFTVMRINFRYRTNMRVSFACRSDSPPLAEQ